MDLVKGGVIGILVTKLDELANKEYGLLKGVKKKIQKQSRELRAVHAVLRKIGDVPPDQLDEQVKDWVCDIREASYDMEDIVDAFLVHVKSSPEPTDTNLLGRLLKNVSRFVKKIKDRHRLSSLIDEINEKLEEVAARRGRYTLDNIGVNPVASTAIDPRILNLYKSATELVGIEGPRDELINMLSLGDDVDGSDMKLKIISVVGSGGLGKTTLAKAVYDHFKPQFKTRASVSVHQNPDMNDAADDQLKPHFECGVFVPVGRNPDMRKVFRDILIGLDEENYSYLKLKGLDENQLMGKLNGFAKVKRCFIVIDDIWDERSWELIKCAMQESNYGSRLIITTRKSEVARNASETYKIQPLSHDNSEKLLFARIGDGEGNYFDSPSSEVCEKILKKCGGVPLAIITLSSLLASKPREDWSMVYNSIGFGHEGNGDVCDTRWILSISYYDLPPHLKPCLLYLSVFPEDHVIDKNSLIWMWKDEGFITKEQASAAGDRVGLYELGEMYFNELINRSMIQPVERNHEGYVEACSVHDMVLDLIHSLLSKENFVIVLNGDEPQDELLARWLNGDKPLPRRLALQRFKEHEVDQLPNSCMEKVRSLIASQCHFGELWPCLPVLRLLDIVDCFVEEDCDQGMLNHLGRSLQLRYLRLSYSQITKLPREVRYLKLLQALDLQGSSIEELLEEVGLLTKLICLRVGYRTRVPDGLISKLTSLQELLILPPADIMQFVKDLGQLKELRVLETRIDVTSESMERALLESLGNLCNIRELHIWSSSPDCVWKSNAGLVSCRCLRFLILECFVFSRLTEWMSLARNLSYLYVKVLAVRQQDIEALANLPELRSLKLHSSGDTKFVSITIRTEGVVYFQKLRILSTSIWFDLHGIQCNSSRVPSNNFMPSLESLNIDIHLRSLKDETHQLQLNFDRLLDFKNLGRTSLQRVVVKVNCRGARASEVEEVETVLLSVAAVHPKHPTLQTTWQEQYGMISPYQEACMVVSRDPTLINKAWNLADIVNSGHIRALHIADPTASSSKVMRLLYTNNGMGLLVLNSSAVHKLWRWKRSVMNPLSQSTTSAQPQLWQPKSGILMTNDTTNGNPEAATACVALAKNDSYIFSASGGKVSLFNMMSFKVMTTFMPAPPAATFMAFHPQDHNIIAIGKEDTSIHIYNIRSDEVEIVLREHQKKITGLAFSQLKNVLVSSGADAQVCVWNMDGWEKKRSRYIEPSSNGPGTLVGDTLVQFHYNQAHILVVHETQLVIYDCQLECLCSWFPGDPLPAPISSAVYSSDGLLVYAGFCDGAIGIFEARSLTLQSRIAASAYIPSSICRGVTAYPMVVAAHPWKPEQIAVGMSDGAVHVLEPPLDTDNVQAGRQCVSTAAPSLPQTEDREGETSEARPMGQRPRKANPRYHGGEWAV